MHRILIAPIVGVACLILYADSSSDKTLLHSSVRSPSPVVIELFTSQGCSSCPAADRLLTRLGNGELRDQILPLSFHVDYWNYLGWKDPFAASSFTQRQYRYGDAFSLNSVYTPQAVLNGRSECVGSSESEIRSAVQKLGSQPALAAIRIDKLESLPEKVRGEAAISIDPELVHRSLAVISVVYENGLITRVTRGENGGRELRNDFVVRRMDTVTTLQPAKTEWNIPFNILLDSSWVRNNLGIAVLVQDLDRLRIHAATTVVQPLEK